MNKIKLENSNEPLIIEMTDCVLPMLKFKETETVRIKIDYRSIRLYIGSRDWEWDLCGNPIGAGTFVADNFNGVKKDFEDINNN